MKKSILSLALIVAMLFCTTNDAIASTINEENPTADSVEYLFDPGSGQYLPVRNIEDEIAAITKASERNYEFEQTFEQARLNRAMSTNPITPSSTEVGSPVPAEQFCHLP